MIEPAPGVTVAPLTPDRFDDFVTVLGAGGKGGCWCMYWIHPTTRSWEEGARGGSRGANREAFLRIVEAGPPPGLLAYDGPLPVGWCRVTPRSRLPGIERSRFFSTGLPTDGVWSLSCFVVARTHRGRGLTTVLTRAAIDHARDAGAAALEVYPTDADEPRSAASVYTGVASTFARLGFEVVQRSAPHKPMMRLELAER